jgi:hypothetical protein
LSKERNVKKRSVYFNHRLDGLSCIAGGGFQYCLSCYLSIEAQWLHVSGYSNILQNVTLPAADLFIGALVINLSNLFETELGKPKISF